ncbi:hypothetical protein tb265_34970 [Gemmatimonadetes bacterium T265]|nr:hypothetical protein tb265_34970 [Gemmatimonadetes bacterium T265]
MSVLYLDAHGVAERRRAVAGPGAPLGALVASLAADLAPVLARPVWTPLEKACLTRVGGTCPRDGARLEFDPFAPRAHRCPSCAAVYDRDEDYRWWIMGYQLWLAERAVHAAALALTAAADARAVDAWQAYAARVLDAQADAYLAYPNVDNVLGPTRPFFSTYLESLWLVHVCTALDFLCASAPGRYDALADRVRARVVEPSRALIASFPEGTSNRQVWHAVARLAASRVLGDARAAEAAVHGPFGIAELLDRALLADGSWYEGENYHQFAHRGFWYALRFAERTGIGVARALVARFRAGYAVPFRVALPDDTLPTRRDAQYAVSLRQWRWAEWCELGLTDGGLARLGPALARLYAPSDPRLPHRTGRWRATGESERNEPASALSRADLGWKSLLFARPELPPVAPERARRCELLPEQGYAVLRRGNGRVYAGLDYGARGGGHGHPDRLNLILQDGPVRWLDDPGTGTYVERALHWYRSTLAHAAPLVDGRSQPPDALGSLVGFDPGPDPTPARATDEPAFAGVAARAEIAPATAARAVVVSDAYVVDLLTWRAFRPCVVDLPLHVDAPRGAPPAAWARFDPLGAGGLEDGFDFVRGAESTPAGEEPLRLTVTLPGAARDANAALWLSAPGASLWRAVAPGPPGTGERRFHAVRMEGTSGAVVSVWDLRGAVTSVHSAADGAITVELSGGVVDQHVVPAALRLDRARAHDTTSAGVADWRVERRDAAGRTVGQRLALVAPPAAAIARPPEAPHEPAPATPYVLPADGRPLTFALGASHYVRSEATWDDAGAPTAVVRISASGNGALVVDVDVRLGRPPAFAPPGAVNPLDNERADVNSDGLQLLLACGADASSPATWLLVPERDAPVVRTTRTTAGVAAATIDAAWRERADGWAVTCHIRFAPDVRPGDVVALDLAVNERPPGRERRRGQLQLSEPASPFVYLRGDRMDATRAPRFLLPPAAPAP